MQRLLLLASAVSLMFAAPARADGDPEMGKRQFAPCTACHTVEEGGAAKLGPNLHDVIGKKAGTNKPDFAYSDALKGSGIVWDEAKLDEWIKKPAALVPGTKMAFIGVGNDAVRANIIAYLKQATK